MLKIENVSKDLGEFRLENVSLEVQDGEYLVIIGPTGAGKTILLETVAGIYPPDSGKVFLNETEITGLPAWERNITMVYQDYMLFPHLNVEENIGFGLKNRKLDKEEIAGKVREVAEIFGIGHLLHRYPDTLSGGEQQRAAISRAIVLEPEVLLLDEPLSALDGQTRERLRTELKKLHSHFGTTIIHITHNFEEVFSLADRVAVMNQGRIIQVGGPDEVYRKPESEFVADFVGVGNLFRGTCQVGGAGSVVDVDGHTIVTAECADNGEVSVTIRPEDILISVLPLDSSARNTFRGRITGITDNGTIVRLSVDAGLQFIVALTRQGWTELALSSGDQVCLTFKASSVHVF